MNCAEDEVGAKIEVDDVQVGNGAWDDLCYNEDVQVGKMKEIT